MLFLLLLSITCLASYIFMVKASYIHYLDFYRQPIVISLGFYCKLLIVDCLVD